MPRYLVTFDSHPRVHGSAVDAPFGVRVYVVGVSAPNTSEAVLEARRIERRSPALPHPSIRYGVVVGVLVDPEVTEIFDWPAALGPQVPFFRAIDRVTGTELPDEEAASRLKRLNRGRGGISAGFAASSF